MPIKTAIQHSAWFAVMLIGTCRHSPSHNSEPPSTRTCISGGLPTRRVPSSPGLQIAPLPVCRTSLSRQWTQRLKDLNVLAFICDKWECSASDSGLHEREDIGRRSQRGCVSRIRHGSPTHCKVMSGKSSITLCLYLHVVSEGVP